MTTDERLDRLELAVGELAVTLTRNYPLRGGSEAAGVAAVQELHQATTRRADAAAASRRREALQAELAELGSAAR